MDGIYMELNEAGMLKFWQIEWQSENGDVCSTYGRIGTQGTCVVKRVQNVQQYVVQAALKKLEEGYVFNKYKKEQEEITNKRRQSAQLSQKRTTGILKGNQRKNNNNGNFVRSKKSLGGNISSQKKQTNSVEKRSSTKVISLKNHAPPKTNRPLGKLDECLNLPTDRFELYSKNDWLYDVLFKSDSSYYILQILVDTESDINVKLYTRWGILGSAGRCQLTNCGSISHALKLFASKFYERTGTEWSDRKNYHPKLGMYAWIKSNDTTTYKEQQVVAKSKESMEVCNSFQESGRQTINVTVTVGDSDTMQDRGSENKALMPLNQVANMIVDSDIMVDGECDREIQETMSDLCQMVVDSESTECRVANLAPMVANHKNAQNVHAGSRIENHSICNFSRTVDESSDTVDGLDNFVPQHFEPLLANLGENVVQSL